MRSCSATGCDSALSTRNVNRLRSAGALLSDCLSGVPERFGHGIGLEVGVGLEDLIRGHSVRDYLDNRCHRDAQPANAGAPPICWGSTAMRVKVATRGN